MKSFTTPARHPAFSTFLLFFGCFLISSFLSFSTAQAQLSGTYTIGGADGDYANFNEAVSDLETQGVSGPVNFKVRSGAYQEQLQINPFPGNSCTNTVSFESESGNPGDVHLDFPVADYVVALNGVNGISFRNLHLSGTGTVMNIKDGADCISLENNILTGAIGEDAGILVNAVSNSGNTADHHSYRGNTFIGGRIGLRKAYESAASDSSPYLDDGLLVISNEFRDQSGVGILLENQQAYRINHNRLRLDASTGIASQGSINGEEMIGNIIEMDEGEFGIYFIGGAPARILQNQIHIQVIEYGGTAMEVDTYGGMHQEMLIANNLIKMSYQHAFSQIGYMTGMAITGTAKVYHNSVLLSGLASMTATTVFNGHGSFHIFNNNFSNLTGGHLMLGPAIAMDYNNLYGASFDLSDWQSRTGRDAHSISVRPDEETTLHPALKGAGLFLAEVPVDLNGKTRNNPPTIGAIEMGLDRIFTIGGEGGDYAGFTEAINALEFNYGLDSLIFQVRPGTYHEQLIIKTNNFRHITFEGESGDSTDVILEYPDDYALRIEGASHFTFRNMTISGKGAVRIEAENDSRANHISFEHNILTSSGDAAAVSTYNNATEHTSNTTINYLAFRNNIISGMGWGIQKEGSIIYYSSHNVYQLSDEGIEVSGNSFITGRGSLYISNTKDINIRNNSLTIENTSSSIAPEGIYIQNSYQIKTINGNHLKITGAGAKGIWIDGNFMGGYFGQNMPEEIIGNNILLPEGGTGISFEWVSSNNTTLMANNMISVKGNNGSVSVLMMESRIKANLYFNSIFLYGDDIQSKALSISDAGSVALANNIFANSAGGYAIHGQHSSSNNLSVIASSDYNAFYTTGETLGYWNDEELANLNEWQLLMGMDENSLSTDPQFESAENFIPANPALDAAGIALEAVTTDFFGKLRSDPPDIGAVEFEAEEPSPAPEPTAGFVNGSGWFYSPAGAISQDPLAEGKAIFSFKAKQNKKDKSPSGHAMLTIPQKQFRFQSQNAWEWLSINENTAILRGTGILNREEGYQFVISVVDYGVGPRMPKDTYRIIIWDSQGNIAYDNQPGSEDYAMATMAIGAGNIMIREESPDVSTVQEIISFVDIKAYPTRLEKENLWLEIPPMEGVEKLQLSIYDMQGSVMASKSFVPGEQISRQLWKLDHRAWSPGIYFLILEGNKLKHQQKLIK